MSSLTRERIVDAALTVLRDYGLADLSMRRLARDLDVQAGALYWHMKNKQELLYAIAESLLSQPPEIAAGMSQAEAVRTLCRHIRIRLSAVHNSAQVVSLAHALHPFTLAVFARLQEVIEGQGFAGKTVSRKTQVLIHCLLGMLDEQQTRAELSRGAEHRQLRESDNTDGNGSDISHNADRNAAENSADFDFAVTVILRGLNIEKSPSPE